MEARRRDPGADRPGAQARRPRGQKLQNAVRTLGGRAAATGHRPRDPEQPAGAAGPRTDRQPRPRDGRRQHAAFPGDRRLRAPSSLRRGISARSTSRRNSGSRPRIPHAPAPSGGCCGTSCPMRAQRPPKRPANAKNRLAEAMRLLFIRDIFRIFVRYFKDDR